MRDLQIILTETDESPSASVFIKKGYRHWILGFDDIRGTFFLCSVAEKSHDTAPIGTSRSDKGATIS